MTNTKENQLNQIKKELNDIADNAKNLNLTGNINNEQDTFDDQVNNNDVYILTDIINEKPDSGKKLSNSELILKLKELQTHIDNQHKVISKLITKIIHENN